MVKYGLFAAQQGQERGSHSLCRASSPLLKPRAVPWCLRFHPPHAGLE